MNDCQTNDQQQELDYLRGASHALTWLVAPAHMTIEQVHRCTMYLRGRAHCGAKIPPYMYWLTLCARNENDPARAYAHWLDSQKDATP